MWGKMDTLMDDCISLWIPMYNVIRHRLQTPNGGEKNRIGNKPMFNVQMPLSNPYSNGINLKMKAHFENESKF